MSLKNNITQWNPQSIVSVEGSFRPFCLVVLNQPIIQIKAFERLWKNASYRIAADGGSNRLYDAFKHDQKKLEQFSPDEIRGDLDSVRPDVWKYYKAKNVKITKVNEQDTTDFMKCVKYIKEKEKESNQIYDIVGTPALGGRFDQTMCNINILYEIQDKVERRCILVNYNEMTILLNKGEHEIQCQLDLKGSTCGLIPFSGPATLTTKGLKWNLDEVKSEFGGLVSTSNAIDNETIYIKTDAPIVWTMEINFE